MAGPLDRFGGVGGLIRKAVPYIATYVFGKKMGERDTRQQAGEETRAQREASDRAGKEARDEMGRQSTGDYIRNKDI